MRIRNLNRSQSPQASRSAGGRSNPESLPAKKPEDSRNEIGQYAEYPISISVNFLVILAVLLRRLQLTQLRVRRTGTNCCLAW